LKGSLEKSKLERLRLFPLIPVEVRKAGFWEILTDKCHQDKCCAAFFPGFTILKDNLLLEF
jgi:hypothetical protein